MSWRHTQVLQYVTMFREPATFNDASLLQMVVLEAVAQEASDIYFQSGYPIIVKRHGEMRALTERRLTTEECLQIVNWAAGNDTASGSVAQGLEVRSSYQAKDAEKNDKRGERVRYRFRVNAIGGEFRNQLGVQVVMRSIRTDAPNIDELGIDPRIIEAITPEDGVVYISGATGSGKSTSFAGMIKYILQGDTPIKGNIVTLESPIEYVFDSVDSEHSVVFQSEIGRGVVSFGQGVISLMRHDPSLIVVGETRDEETASAVLAAATTGHPVYTTVHSNSSATIPTRILSFYEPAVRDSMLFSLINTTRVLVNQRLVPSRDGRRTPLREFLVLTSELREQIIATADPRKITSVMADLVERHGVSMAHASEIAFNSGLISEATMTLNRKV